MMRSRNALASLLVVAISLTAGMPTGAAAIRNGRIAFTRYNYEHGSSNSWSIRPNGADPRPILADGRRAYAAAFSPNGKRIAVGVFSGGRHHLRIIDLQGDVHRTVDSFDATIISITWSPDGSKLAFALSAQGPDTVWVIRRDGSGGEMIAARATAPRWSPDGRWILIAAGRRQRSVLKVVRPSGADRHLVVRNAFYGTWSPHGDSIAFYRSVGPEDDEQLELFVADRDGSDKRRLTHSARWSESAPIWSPRGGWLAYSRFDKDVGAVGGLGDLFKLNLRTGARVRLTGTTNADEWFPMDWQRRRT